MSNLDSCCNGRACVSYSREDGHCMHEHRRITPPWWMFWRLAAYGPRCLLDKAPRYRVLRGDTADRPASVCPFFRSAAVLEMQRRDDEQARRADIAELQRMAAEARANPPEAANMPSPAVDPPDLVFKIELPRTEPKPFVRDTPKRQMDI